MITVKCFARYRPLLGFDEVTLPLVPTLGTLLADPRFAALPPDALRVLPCPVPLAPADRPAFAVSTGPYPDWPVASMPHTPFDLNRQVAVALLSLPAADPAAKSCRILGYRPPDNYQDILSG